MTNSPAHEDARNARPADPAENPLEQRVIDVLRTIYDPELPVNIYDLGLIYGITATAAGAVHIRMTLTTPACPVARSLPAHVEKEVRALEGVTEFKLELVWEPRWSKERLSPAARLTLGLDDPAGPRLPRRHGFVPLGNLQRRPSTDG